MLMLIQEIIILTKKNKNCVLGPQNLHFEYSLDLTTIIFSFNFSMFFCTAKFCIKINNSGSESKGVG